MSLHESITRALTKKENEFYDSFNGRLSLYGLIIGAIALLIVFMI